MRGGRRDRGNKAWVSGTRCFPTSWRSTIHRGTIVKNALPPITTLRQTGKERFHSAGKDLGFDLRSFWQWSVSDLVSNATRGRLAEYLVARVIDVGQVDVRSEWDPFDLTSPSGVKIEVKSAAYIQSWYQSDFSKIVFSIGPTRAWDAATNRWSKVATRHAHVYVFALLAHLNQDTLDPLNLDQWEFFVLHRSILDQRRQSQRTITLNSLLRLGMESVPHTILAEKIEEVARHFAV